MASNLKFHSSKLSFLSALNPPSSNLVMLFKSSLQATKPFQSLCLSLPLNSLTCDLKGSVCPPPNSSCQSSTSISHPILPWLRPPFFHPYWLTQTPATLFPFYNNYDWPWAIGSSETNTSSLALSPCYTLTILLPTCIPYLLPYLLQSMPSPSLPTPGDGRSWQHYQSSCALSHDWPLPNWRNLAPLMTQPPILKNLNT
jgi:hypothetical protein